MEQEQQLDLERLSKKAQEVAALTNHHTQAIEQERDAEVQILQAIIDLVKPALPGCCSRLMKVDRSTSGRNGCNPVEEKDWFDERGIVLVDEFAQGRDPDGNRGWLGGYKIVLLEDGSLARIKREGSWSRWQGEWSGWEATIQPITVKAVMDREELSDCIQAIERVLDRQLDGKRENQAKEAVARTERLRAIIKLTG